MVSNGSVVEGGETQLLSARVRRTIQSIKEIVGNHSELDIYAALKETNMDPNETAQKLLNQDPFHEVKRRRDKKKENLEYRGSVDPQSHSENVGQGMKLHPFSDRNVRRGGYTRKALPGIKFRVVRDNRVNQNTDKEVKPVSPQHSRSTNEKAIPNVPAKGLTETSGSQKPSGGRSSAQTLNGLNDSHNRHPRDASLRKNDGKVPEEKRSSVPYTNSRMQAAKSNNSHPSPASLASSSSAVGVYFSSTDPVHVPSPDSRPSGTVGAIKREVGVVGVRRQHSENSVKMSTMPSNSFANSLLVKDGSSESFRPLNAFSRTDQRSQTTATDSVIASMSVSRSFLSNQNSGRPHQQPVSHQKASQHKIAWKPKSSQKSAVSSPGVIGTPTKSISPPAENLEDLESETDKLQDKLSSVNIYENQNVIIAQHIRVPETDRCRLTFGSIGTEFDSSRNLVSGLQAVGTTEESNGDPAASLSASAPEFSGDDASGSRLAELHDGLVRNSGSDSPASVVASEHQLPDKKQSSSPQNLDNYADIGLVRDNSPSYAPSELQHHQDPPELSGFSQAYDPQTGYDIPYFRPTVDETIRGQGLPSPQEALSSHTTNSIPASTIAMVQQQQPPVAQMYPQVHVSHFANLMPYRQFLPPLYVSPMAMPGYSSNAAYPHPSNGSSYLLMPGGSSHLNASSLKYGVQQFKPVPAGSPTGFGNFNNPTGYINAPGVVGGANGLEDSSRIKYKDGNIYVSNPQAEASEIWIQNPRELPGMQSTPYYNMPAQSPHGAYMPSHTGHASFNAAAAQSSHMQFPGMYHPPPQPAAITSPHHLGPAMGGNVGVGVAAAAPGAQVGAYQQPQLGHLNWTTNF
ncbi:GBF-interacting protein 1-like isoform X1 [Juglans microcarpa x Juglans regia]|uniref:GBF-interacting protein 1-like isoform X1 n=1 Tax=Juglans microcarpa x Juglans regia TaxID=2249226 RepID=UPI001B7DEB02|nr:GBF-interacting protein 1-like isoform X1 [Juglans microcarpa x Juglans regia]